MTEMFFMKSRMDNGLLMMDFLVEVITFIIAVDGQDVNVNCRVVLHRIYCNVLKYPWEVTVSALDQITGR